MSNTPYTYLIGWATLNKWYYGVRYSKSCDPSDLWNPYKTSSKIVKRFISENGQPDVIEIRKTFNDVNSARRWEQRVLIKLNVIHDDKWLNGHNTISFDPTLVPKGKDHWTKRRPDILKNRKYSSGPRQTANMKRGEEHWTHKNHSAAINHSRRMNSSENPNNLPHVKSNKSDRLKIDNPVNIPGVRDKISKTLTGLKQPRKICEHCGKDIGSAVYTRHHGPKCKYYHINPQRT